MIIAVRIDGRLVHGQVANLWTPKLDIQRIMVVDNEVAENDIEKAGLRMAAPSGVRLSVLPYQKAANHILAHKYDSQRMLIVVKKPYYLLKLIQAGVPIEEINVGNMSQTETTKHINQSINVDETDVKEFKELNKLGIKLVHQMVPGGPVEDFMKILEAK